MSGRKWLSTSTGLRKRGGSGLGPCPEGRVGRSRLSVKVVLDIGEARRMKLVARD